MCDYFSRRNRRLEEGEPKINVADPGPFDPWIRDPELAFFPDPGSHIPNPYFSELSDNIQVKKITINLSVLAKFLYFLPDEKENNLQFFIFSFLFLLDP